MNFKEFVISLFKDERGNISIKPVIAFLGVLSLIITLIISVLSNKVISVPEALIYALVTIICVAMGADTADKYSFKKLIDKSDVPINLTQENNQQQS